jgi:hypothetical protein
MFKSRKKKQWPTHKPHKSILPTHLLLSQGPWFFLFHILLGLIIFYPLFETAQEARMPWIFNLVNSIIVLFIINCLSFNARQLTFSLILGLSTIALYWFTFIPYHHLLSIIFTCLLYGYAILMIIAFVFHSHNVGMDEVYSATSVYLLLGMLWARLYEVVEFIHPHSFYISPEVNIDGVLNWSDFLYFSFTTLTTLGYGNLVPVTSYARSLAVLEAITGVIFISVMISRAIGLYITASVKKLKLQSKS